MDSKYPIIRLSCSHYVVTYSSDELADLELLRARLARLAPRLSALSLKASTEEPQRRATQTAHTTNIARVDGRVLVLATMVGSAATYMSISIDADCKCVAQLLLPHLCLESYGTSPVYSNTLNVDKTDVVRSLCRSQSFVL